MTSSDRHESQKGMSNDSLSDAQRHQLAALVGKLIDDCLDEEDESRLTELLRSSRAARDYYAAAIAIHAELLAKHEELSHLGPLVEDAKRKTVSSQLSAISHQPPGVSNEQSAVSKPMAAPIPTPTVPNIANPQPEVRNPQSPLVGFLRSTVDAVIHPIAIWSVVGIVAVGVIGLAIWGGRFKGHQEQAAQAPPSGLAAQLVNLGKTTDARWDEGFAPEEKEAIQHGRRLRLVAGLAELKFPGNATVLVEGPADFKVVDGDTCWLQFGRLTAHVPEQARGFEVLSPTARAVDQGTEFGVSVGNPSAGDTLPPADGSVVAEQQLAEPAELRKAPNQSPTSALQSPTSTEVHVFRGKVSVARSEVGSRKSDTIFRVPTSDLRPPTSNQSEILSAGSAVVVTTSDVKPLPAVDPFKFALDKFHGKPRTVLLSEDFEKYELGAKQGNMGDWIIQGSVRKGQGVFVYDPAERLETHFTRTGQQFPNLSPPPPVGTKISHIAASGTNPRNTFPLLAAKIDGRPLATDCQVLIEFDLFPDSADFQTSLTLGTEIGRTGGIELFRNADEARKIEWPPYQWYRLRLLLNVTGGAVRQVRAERSHWLGLEGWVRDLTYHPATSKLAWTAPPRYVIFGYPAVTATTPATIVWIDNVRVEVIAKK